MRARSLTASLFTCALSAAASAAAATHTVTIEGMQFKPATLNVHSGDTVVWKNLDFFPHNVTAGGKVLKSPAIASNGSWKFVAKKKGRYPYICTLHPTMKGTLVVQ